MANKSGGTPPKRLYLTRLSADAHDALKAVSEERGVPIYEAIEKAVRSTYMEPPAKGTTPPREGG